MGAGYSYHAGACLRQRGEARLGQRGFLVQRHGVPAVQHRAGIAVAVVMVGGIAALIGFGTVGVAVAVVAANVFGYIYNIYQMHTVLPEASGKMLPTALPAFAGSLIMAGGMYLVRVLLPPAVTGLPAFLVLGAMGVVGIGLYTGFLFLFQRSLLLELWTLLRGVRG